MNNTILKAAKTIAECLYDSGIRQGKLPAGAILYAERKALELNSSDDNKSAFYPYVVDALRHIKEEL